ncbi:unnamed protein product [Lepeophtheirus salmonis]|uniref:(salmon louse) hypothetical protein n=1 Tax=Lepeophtheirus salmonis TaxID=72036 RepID=A0A7R8CT87_LEPSM|nr:unnamed protein product [Lepeophtheirus salmonis]CAF2886530.1 unnamed protein product [Lepeophtheirus salmonis]
MLMSLPDNFSDDTDIKEDLEEEESNVDINLVSEILPSVKETISNRIQDSFYSNDDISNTTLASLTSAELNSIALYDQLHVYNCYGYEKDLAAMDFDNKVDSTKVNGIWILYENINYNTDDEGMSFFTYEALVGEEQYYTNDIPYPVKSVFGKSLIVTGCDEWTIYSEKYFAGESVCVKPIDMDNCSPTFYPTVDKLGLGHRLRSARRGCHSMTSVRGIEFPLNTTGIFDPKTKGYKLL